MSLPAFTDMWDCEDEEVQQAIEHSLMNNSVNHMWDSQSAISHGMFEKYGTEEEFRDDGTLNGLRNSSLFDLSTSSFDSSCHTSTSPSLVPLCRQFWRAGEYNAGVAPRPSSIAAQNRMRVHPKFLHSNATSHKWVFGAIAELLDNAVDEAQNGASFVIIDKLTNIKSGHALLIQDDGGGMDPESLRHCLSFGFSDKLSDSSIGQYGNGFKTSTMRLGADAVVFTRCHKERTLTQSVGLLSYTFLRQTGCDDVIVPMVDYKFDTVDGGFVRFIRHGQKEFHNNLSTLLRWSPFAGEENLLKQFDHLGHHGTRVIVFNLWLNDDGYPELDFDTNKQDIIISGALDEMHNSRFAKNLNQNHVGNQFRYSLRAYSSILYLHLPERFKIFLRGCLVEPHYIAGDLMYTQCIKYKPQATRTIESTEIGTVIGFLNGAPNLDIHGFNIYHRNRLILAFWRVAHKCKGVVGVLETDCLNPTHDKQDFEKSEMFQKLEIRLKEMAWEYCYLKAE
ncbi:hypothetical protein AXF42_Ash003801 [Apostasia shenzhenica]|uniref:Morc S5 domain-containing protein n=1 Tax=Apostasia shenzhenica TaxID=1088818 RepID=A0A2I0AHX7_9ASPA|nr:hypothetical protein AXF42_Ash003801 [Apostasia shenzhenica]